MTTALKTYLIAHLLPGLAAATASRDEYAEREREATDPLDAEYCRKMRKHYQSQVEVWQKNVDEARERLEEEEEPPRHPLHCKCAECEDGRGDREHETRWDRELDREER